MNCLCTVCPALSSRKLQTLQTTTYQILGVTKYLFSDYAATMATAPELTDSKAVVAKSIVVIMSFIAVWAFVLVIVGAQVDKIYSIFINITNITIRNFGSMVRMLVIRRRLS